MSLWSNIPVLFSRASFGRSLLSCAPVITGFGVISFHYNYAAIRRISVLLLLIGVTVCLLSARQLYQASACESRNDAGTPAGRLLLRRMTLTASWLLLLTGIFLAMILGPASVGVVAILMLLLFSRVTLSPGGSALFPIQSAFEQAALVILGYTAYPLLVEIGAPAALKLPVLFVGLFALSLALPWSSAAPKEERRGLAYATAGGGTVLLTASVLLPSTWEVPLFLGLSGMGLILVAALSSLAPAGKQRWRFLDFSLLSALLLETALVISAGYQGGYTLETRALILLPMAGIALFSLTRGIRRKQFFTE